MLLIQKLKKHISVGLDYGNGNHNIFGLKEVENRFMGQTNFLHNIDKFAFNHCIRYEYRIPLNLKTNIKDDASQSKSGMGLLFSYFNQESKIRNA